jgi:hypothetical protein
MGMFEACLKANVPEAQLSVTQIEGRALSRSTALDSIANLRVGENDAVLWFYCGHGYDEEDGRGTYFSPARGGGDVYLEEIEAELRRKQARLVLLIADCCHVKANRLEVLPKYYYGNSPDTVTPLARQLFFESTGVWVVNSSAPGEYSVVGRVARFGDGRVTTDARPLFTSVLSDRLGNEQFRRNRSSWETVFRDCQSEISRQYKMLCPQGVLTLGSGRRVRQLDQTITVRRNNDG